jgi:hypothetical protein
MDYWVDCICGNRIEVSETQAGTTVPCRCGSVVPVPRLSELRSQAGQSPNDVSPELVIRYPYGSGKEVVGGDTCAWCGATPSEPVLCFIECEKPVNKGEHSWLFWVLFGLWNLPLATFYYLVRREPKVVSEGKTLEFRLALCSPCQKAALGTNSLPQVLRKAPVFARLFDKYPEARVCASAPVPT